MPAESGTGVNAAAALHAPASVGGAVAAPPSLVAVAGESEAAGGETRDEKRQTNETRSGDRHDEAPYDSVSATE